MTPLGITIPYGLCHCGCGQKTLISVRSYKGTKPGDPRRYLQGHNKFVRTPLIEAQPFKIKSEYCRLIPLTRGLWCIVSAHRYEYLMQWKWAAWWWSKTQKHYAVRSGPRVNGNPTRILMHRLILGLENGDRRRGDHVISEETLNNSDNNIRPGTASQNNQNSRKRSDNTTGFKGVYFYKDGRRKPYSAYITVDKKRINLGYYETAEEAYAAYCEAAKKYFGEFARLE